MPYNTAAWQKKRARLLRDQPLCVFCKSKGKIVPATVADHVEPHRGDYNKFWNGALQGLCKYCHDSTKARIEAGTLKPEIGVDGWPVHLKG